MDSADRAPVYVGFWARMLAFLIDNIAVSLLIAPLVFMILGEIRLEDFDLQDATQLAELMNRLALQLSLDALFLGVIFILFWIVKSATPGKMLIGSSIVDAKTLGKASNGQNLVRYLAYFVSLIPLGLGFIWIGLDSKKQGWHDKIAGTLVIKGAPHPESGDTPEPPS